MKQSILGFIFALLLLMGALAASPVSDSGAVAAEGAAASQTLQPEPQSGPGAAPAPYTDGCII